MFTYPLEDYQRNLDVLPEAVETLAWGLSKSRNISLDAARAYINNNVVSKINSKGPTATFTVRQKNGDRVVKEAPIVEYLDKIRTAGLGVSPTLTTYKRPDQEESLIVAGIASDMDERKIVKHEANQAKQAKRMDEATIKGGGQNAIKTSINSWSGAALDKYNTFHCPSLHPTLTTMCRISTALATAVIERFAAGKRYYHTTEKMIEDILHTIKNIDISAISSACATYNLKTATPNTVMAMMERSAAYYIFDDSWKLPVRTLLGNLNSMELTAIMYDLDFYHLFEHNPEQMKTLLSDMYNIDDALVGTDADFKALDGDQIVMLSNLLGDEMGGTNIRDVRAESDNPMNQRINAVANNILAMSKKYSLLFSTFFRTNHYPLGCGAQNNAIRLAVPLGDTDSTVYTTKLITEKFYGESTFHFNQEPVNDVCVWMINGVIGHMLGNFTAQLGVVKERRKLLIMKNEFKFPCLQLTPVAKTYHAAVKACEGLVYNEMNFEMKGARFHASKANIKLIKDLHKVMERNQINLNQGKLIDRGEVIDMICEVEEDIEASLSRTDNVFFQRARVKPKDEYAAPYSNMYGHYALWQAMWAHKYDSAPDPTYMAYKVPVEFPEGIKVWIESLPPVMQKGYLAWIKESDKKDWATPTAFYVPMDNFFKHGLPEEIKPLVNNRKLIKGTLDAHYLYLSALGLNHDYGDGQRILTDMV